MTPSRGRVGLLCLGLIVVPGVLTAAGAKAQAPLSVLPPAQALSAAPIAAADPVIGAVGDMACDPADPRYRGGVGTTNACAQSRTSNRVFADTELTAVLGLGDYQYVCGDPSDYAISYDPTWGRIDAKLRPTAGNHEYQTGSDGRGGTCPGGNTSAQSYFSRFGPSAHGSTGGHFSLDIGTWHLVGLNSNCGKTGVGGCGTTSQQTSWLKADLAATDQPCIAAFWHHPLFTAYGGSNGNAYKPWWDVLIAAHADVVLNAHVHNYQRYSPRTPSGVLDLNTGITEFVVGTGGEDLFAQDTRTTPQPEVFLKTFGYLRMSLNANGWSASFVDVAGVVRDTSEGTCHS